MKTNRALEHCALTLMVLPLLLLGSGCNKSRAQPNTKSNAKVEELFKPKLEAIRQAGYPATLAEWNDWYTTPPAADNAASLYQQAFDALAPDDANSPSFLARNRNALLLLHQVAPGKECRYPVDLNQGFYALLPHLLKVRKCAQLLSQEAASLARKLETEAASQSIVEGLRVARSLETEPMLISYKMLLTSEGIMQTGLETVLNRQAFSSAQLTQLQTAFADAENGVALTRALTRALAGERCQGVAFFQLPPPEQEKMFATSVIANRSTNAEVFRSGSDLKPDLDFYLDRMEECLTVAALPFPKSLEGMSQWNAQVNDAKARGYQVSGFLLPSLVPVFERAAECAARLRVAQAALAVERFRAAHQNALPESLSQLSPQFLRVVPADPFDGQPLRYKKLSPVGYVVYSVGKYRSDDGGQAKQPGGSAEASFDLTFTVRR